MVIQIKSNAVKVHPSITWRSSCCPHCWTISQFASKLILSLYLAYTSLAFNERNYLLLLLFIFQIHSLHHSYLQKQSYVYLVTLKAHIRINLRKKLMVLRSLVMVKLKFNLTEPNFNFEIFLIVVMLVGLLTLIM